MKDPSRVLLADDEDLFRDTTADLLRKAGYACDCASDAAEAAGLIASTRYDVLISDIKMPGNAELQLVFKANELARGMPIILVTGYPTLDTAVEAVHSPVVAYLIKPVNFEELLALVEQSVARSSLYRTVMESRKRLKLWGEEMGGLQELLQGPLKEGVAEPARSMLTTTFEIVAKSLLDLRRVTEVLAVTDETIVPSETVGLLNKLDLTRNALRETISVLEESKQAFKSKRLGELRRQLQGLLGVLGHENLA